MQLILILGGMIASECIILNKTPSNESIIVANRQNLSANVGVMQLMGQKYLVKCTPLIVHCTINSVYFKKNGLQ